MSIQLKFDLLEEILYISDTCKQCKNKCKIYSVSKCVKVYCNKYRKVTKI